MSGYNRSGGSNYNAGNKPQANFLPLIVGCSAKNPCTKVAYVPRAALSLKSMNNHYAVMQDLVPACLSNTGSPLRCIKKRK